MYVSHFISITIALQTSLEANYSAGRRDPKCNYQLPQGEQGRRRLRSQLQEACGEEDRAANEGLQVFFFTSFNE